MFRLPILSRILTGKKTRDGMYKVTPRKLLKTLRGELIDADRKDIATVPEDIYFAVVKLFPKLPFDTKMEIAERIDSVFLEIPDKDKTT